MGTRLPSLAPGLLLLGVLAGPAGGDALRVGHWQQTTWYRHTFDADEARDALLRITAAGEYVLYLNGAEVAADGDWLTAEAVPVSVQQGDNHIALAVTNLPGEGGAGLLLSLQGGPLVARSTFSDETSPWYWTGERQDGTGWTTAAVQDTWRRVGAGSIDRVRVSEAIFHPEAEAVAGYPNEVNLAGSPEGRIVLADQRGRNIALGANASEVGVTDGNIGLPVWSLPQGLGALNRVLNIALPELTRIERVRVITKPPEGNETWEGNSLLGYSVQISEDQSRWIEMGGLNDIENHLFTEVRFNPVLARHVRVQVTQAEVGADPAKVAEVQIYGVDFVPAGAYVSPPLDLGDPEAVKNFGRVRWWGEVPPATSLGLQFSTGDSPDTQDGSWSAWSEEFEDSGALIPSPEPRRYLRYRVNLRTDDLEFTPALDSLEIGYDPEGIAARSATASVVPNEAPMGQDVDFLVSVGMALEEGDALERIRLRLPSLPTAVNSIQLLGQEIAVPEFPTGEGGLDAGGRTLWVTPTDVRDLDVAFDPPLTSADGSEISFAISARCALYTDTHEFRAALFSPGSENPLNVLEETADGASWTVVVTDVVVGDLLQVRAQPPAFSPNGDGINDFTVIEFALAKVTEPRRVDVDLYDLRGRRVRRLETPRLIGGRYLHPGLGAAGSAFSPGFWDGRDDAGNLVPPGIYLFSVRANLDGGDEAGSGVVHVVY